MLYFKLYGDVLDYLGYYKMADLWDKFAQNTYKQQRTAAINTKQHPLFQLTEMDSPEAIKKLYHTFIRQFHPDINKDPDATRAMQEANAFIESLGKRMPKQYVDINKGSEPKEWWNTWDNSKDEDDYGEYDNYDVYEM
jgi:DnaJ-class molecular chaperone